MSRAMVIVNGDDIHHDLIAAASVFQQLGVEAGFAARRAMGLNRFVDPRPETAENDVYLLYTAGGEFATAQQQALADAVRAGKGLVGVHGANILGWRGDGLDPAYRPFFGLLGNRYLSHGPGHHEGRHAIEIVAEHPITAGLDDFELFDEYYEFELADDEVTVLAQRRRADGVAIPVLYAREFGAGRVVYLALGHDMRSWGEPPVRALVRQSLRWAAGIQEDS
ncbi:ThuA domain-containing protein [Actinospica sp.]|uniref:ThuA domain-containing protein n=1 Tax=Actinospica sp. TaxID=1872142 RepID=UPI002D197EB0|nr:ThuA domain-containing protein [Actinospica sp.]HWG27132.1 ThuA domain-containing protein [Actinospica sp.]